MDKGAQAIAALLIVIPLVVGGLGLVYYLGLLLVRSLRAPRQEDCQPRQSDEEEEKMNLSLSGALGTLKETYKKATSTYVELWEWEEQEREREAMQAEMRERGMSRPMQHSRAGSLPVPAPRPVAQPQVADDTPEPFDIERLNLGKGLERLLDEKALIVLGPKGSGKTTLGLALLHAVIYLNHEFCVIDPHAELNDWPEDLVVAGAGRNYAEANAFLRAVYAEMDIRYKKEYKARRTPLFVFVDEVPGISAKCKNWALVEDIIREARKVDIHFIILSQSELVKDIGLNTATKTNFTVLALGKARQAHMSEMTQLDKLEKRALTLAYRPYQRAAVLDGEGMPALMDLTGADKVRTDRAQRIWQPDSLVLDRLDKAEREAMPVAQVARDDSLLAGLLSRVSTDEVTSEALRIGTSPGSTFGTTIGTSDALSEKCRSASKFLKVASAEELEALRHTVFLFTQSGLSKTAAIKEAWGATGGDKFLRASELFDAWKLMKDNGFE